MPYLRKSLAVLTAIRDGIAFAIDAVLTSYLHAVNPRYVVTLFLLGNVIQSAVAWVLTVSWNDWYTASGYWVTVTGFLVAISELYRARTSADQIRQARVREATRQRRSRYRYFLDRSRTMLALARAHVDGYEWQLAVVRLGELVEAVGQINAMSDTADDRWTDLTTAVRGWMTTFDAGTNNRRLVHDGAAWMTLMMDADRASSGELAATELGGEADDAP